MNALALAREAITQGGAWQDERDLAELLGILEERIPNAARVLEIGVGVGGTLWTWRRVWPAATIVAVDVRTPPCEACDARAAHSDCPKARVRNAADVLVVADSVRERANVVASVLAATTQRRYHFLHIDGDHNYEAARSDFNTYTPLVAAGGVVAIHDIYSYAGVARLWEELREEYGDRAEATHRYGNTYGYGVVYA